MNVPAVICSLNPDSAEVKMEAVEALNIELVEVYVPSSCLAKPNNDEIFELSVVAPILISEAPS